MSALLNNFALMHHKNAIAVYGCLKSVRHQNNCSFAAQTLESLYHPLLVLQI
jgi:hypothetical protein